MVPPCGGNPRGGGNPGCSALEYAGFFDTVSTAGRNSASTGDVKWI